MQDAAKVLQINSGEGEGLKAPSNRYVFGALNTFQGPKGPLHLAFTPVEV